MKISKQVRDELIAALKRTKSPREILALARRVDDLSALREVLDMQGVTPNLLALLEACGATLTEGEVVEALRSYP